MANLGETIATLAQRRRANPTDAVRTASTATELVEVTGFGANPGNLRMLFHAPAGLPKSAPLVVALHGCGQSAERYAAEAGWIELAARLGFAVLAPEQSMLNNFNRCFNWFVADDIDRGQGEAASIAQMVRYAVRAKGLDERRVFVTGLSAGGAMATVLLATYPELFAGGGVIAGIPYGVARGLQDGLRVMHKADGRGAAALGDLVRKAAAGTDRPALRLSIWQGDADRTVNPANAQDIAEQWANVLELPPAPQAVNEQVGVRRTLWRRASGRAAVELIMVEGMGHGAPLSTSRPGDVGATAPFMLEAGISSTLEMATFWGLLAVAEPEKATEAAIADNVVGPQTIRGLGGFVRRLPSDLSRGVTRVLQSVRLRK